MEYPWGIEGTWTHIWELVTIMPRIENAHTNYLAQLIEPAPLPPTGDVLSTQPVATNGFSSKSSNSVTGPVHRENEKRILNVNKNLYEIPVFICKLI